jgi:hypothetical protein
VIRLSVILKHKPFTERVHHSNGDKLHEMSTPTWTLSDSNQSSIRKEKIPIGLGKSCFTWNGLSSNVSVIRTREWFERLSSIRTPQPFWEWKTKKAAHWPPLFNLEIVRCDLLGRCPQPIQAFSLQPASPWGASVALEAQRSAIATDSRRASLP